MRDRVADEEGGIDGDVEVASEVGERKMVHECSARGEVNAHLSVGEWICASDAGRDETRKEDSDPDCDECGKRKCGEASVILRRECL